MSNNKLLRMLQGEEVNLHDLDPGLHKVHVGLGWKAADKENGFDLDLDASAFLLGNGDRVLMDTDFVFYNNLQIENGVVKHLGDNQTGAEGKVTGDCEAIEVDLDEIHFDVEKIVFSVTIHNCEERQQNFGLVKDAYIRIVNSETKEELIRFNLADSASEDDAFIFGELYRLGVNWRFKALGQGLKGGLYKIANSFHVNVAPI